MFWFEQKTETLHYSGKLVVGNRNGGRNVVEGGRNVVEGGRNVVEGGRNVVLWFLKYHFKEIRAVLPTT